MSTTSVTTVSSLSPFDRALPLDDSADLSSPAPQSSSILPRHAAMSSMSTMRSIGHIGYINEVTRSSRKCLFAKLVQTIILRPITTTATLAFRAVKLITWVPLRIGVNKVSGNKEKSKSYFKGEYLRAVKAARDVYLIPSFVKRAFKNFVATHEDIIDDIKEKPIEQHLNPRISYELEDQRFSSYWHDYKTVGVVKPQVVEAEAKNEVGLNTIMASRLFMPNTMAINFGCPNVAAFVTGEEWKEVKRDDGSIEKTVDIIKVDAKSMWREKMQLKSTGGIIQSGVFLVPTNLPPEAVARFKQAATEMVGRKDITCVNTNARVLKQAGFSIEGVDLEKVIFPQTLMEHLMFRHVFYTDSAGVKHKVHFGVINTTKQKLEEYFESVDTAVVGTRLRHHLRNLDTDEDKKVRGAAARALITQEADRLAAAPIQQVNGADSVRRRVSVSVPSTLGNLISHIWGRHTLYEIDLSDKKAEIAEAFQKLAAAQNREKIKLSPFPHEKPSLGTRLKKYILFSGPVIRFLRSHMRGRVDVIDLHTQNLFNGVKATKGNRINYVVLDDKVVLTLVDANSHASNRIKKIADWALSKHALGANRADVNCSGEMRYEEATGRFIMNHDSGTYLPTPAHARLAAKLANSFFGTERFVAEEDANAPVAANAAAAAVV